MGMSVAIFILPSDRQTDILPSLKTTFAVVPAAIDVCGLANGGKGHKVHVRGGRPLPQAPLLGPHPSLTQTFVFISTAHL